MSKVSVGQKVAANIYGDIWVEGYYQGISFEIDKNGKPVIQSKVSYGKNGRGVTIASKCIPLEEFDGVLSHDADYECWTGDIGEDIDINFGVHHYHRYGGHYYR